MTEVARILSEIVERRRLRVAKSGETWPSREEALGIAENAFLGALAARRGRAVIAEVKMGSPRIGSLAGRVDPEAQARLYRDHGAAALSVVVEPDHFHGSYELLVRCREASGLPAIAKDFVVDPVQLRWAREAGASAVLLIAALYDAAELARLAGLARGLGLVPLVETHDEEDVGRLDGAAWELVGINNRDLRTFDVDLARSEALVPRLPPGALRVAESGIATGADVARLSAAGFDAFLIGESLLLADDPAAQLADLLSGAEEHGPEAHPNPLIKICGVTRPEDAALAVELGADLIGLNFFPPSPRYLDPTRDAGRIREIAAAADGRALSVGVFVDRSAGEMEEIAAAFGLGLVQLHGDEGPEVAARFGSRAIRVFRRASIDAEAMAAEVALYPHAWGFLFDAPRRAAATDLPDPYGGTGESWDHGAVRNLVRSGALDRPVLVAGGLRPGNARAALAASGARGIDVCSGVESAPGIKDADRMRRLFEEVRHGHAAP